MKNLGPSLLLLLGLAQPLRAQAPAEAATGFARAAADVQRQLEESLAELAQLRAEIATEQIPLAKQLGALEGELTQARLDYQQAARVLDGRTLDLGNLQGEIKAREEESAYLANLLSEYGRNFESRLHIAELARYAPVLEAAKLAPENTAASTADVFRAQSALLDASLERLHEALGGARFDGTAVDASGLVKQGTFVLVGPAALFRSTDGQALGSAEQRLGSLEPSVIAFEDPADQQAASELFAGSGGRFPLDPTLGNAHKVESTDETLWEHVQRGGPVMVPIFVLAGAALLVGLYKWLRLVFVRRPSEAEVRALLAAVARRDRAGALDAARELRGPAGEMLLAGVEHLGEPRELVEEVMYESVLSTRLKLQRMLPFVAITASSAPLLGLLGTVTGIMNTFTLMTVFGTGDIKTLSSGISEALITTEYGLYVAIPSLLLHAFLTRKTRGVIDHMEKSAIALVNQVAKTPYVEAAGGSDVVSRPPARSEPLPAATA